MIKATNDLEAAMSEGTNYWDTFKGIDRRRTEITCMVWSKLHLFMCRSHDAEANIITKLQLPRPSAVPP